jgi:hypothetical protein
MMSMQVATAMPDQAKVLVDGKGLPTKTYWLLFRALWNRTGMGSGVPIQVDNNLTAAGTNQATALQLNLDWNEVLTTPSGSGVVLLSIQPGQTQTVYNGGLNSLKVYPSAGRQTDKLGVNAAYSLASGKTQQFECLSSTQFRSAKLG